MDAMKVGMAAWRLGAGRSRQGEAVQAGAGIEIHAKPGEQIAAVSRDNCVLASNWKLCIGISTLC